MPSWIVAFFILCLVSVCGSLVYTIVRQTIDKTSAEGFQSPTESLKAKAKAKGAVDLSGCADIPLSAFDTKLVLSYLSADYNYAISNYSVGALNYLPKIQKSFNEGSVQTQMAMSALLGRYLALNGGSAGTPGPGYTKTSPGNYVAQLLGAQDLLTPSTIDTSSPIYPSFKAAYAVSMCPKVNKNWVSTADF